MLTLLFPRSISLKQIISSPVPKDSSVLAPPNTFQSIPIPDSTVRYSMRVQASMLLCATLLGCIGLLSGGCNSLPQNIALGAVVATGVGAVIPGHDIEQVYYLGAFDPQEQVPPSLFRVRVRGQASILSWMRFGSGWVPANLIDSLGSSVDFNKKTGVAEIIRTDAKDLSSLKIGRRLVQFGPEGFREVPKNHRLVLVMGANPEHFFNAMDRALGDVGKAAVEQENSSLHQELFEALTLVKSEREMLDSAARDLQADWTRSGGK